MYDPSSTGEAVSVRGDAYCLWHLLKAPPFSCSHIRSRLGLRLLKALSSVRSQTRSRFVLSHHNLFRSRLGQGGPEGAGMAPP
jgi:hypothetical protein